MILNTYSKVSQAQYGAQSTGSVGAWYGESEGVTLEDLYDLILELINFMKKQGFRRERPSRQELSKKLDQILTETIDNRKELRQLRSASEETDERIRQLQEHQEKDS